jgi:hypothetical protein
VRAEADEVVITTVDEEILVDTTPFTLEDQLADEVFARDADGSSGRSRLVMAVIAALATILVILALSRRRRSGGSDS